jgi:four helix bundle protein
MVKNLLLEKSYEFSLKVTKLHIQLCEKTKYIYPLSLQLVKSGTSIGANIEEAIGGYSERDFAAKLSISYKEARETRYWLRLLGDTNFIDLNLQSNLLNDIDELIRILGAIIRTIKRKQKVNKAD